MSLRTPLPSGTRVLLEGKDSHKQPYFKEFEITSVLGQGASSIVYTAKRPDSLQFSHNVILKELYPVKFAEEIIRRGSQLIIDEKCQVNFKTQKQRFQETYRKHTDFQRHSVDSTLEAQDIYTGNDTVYIVMEEANGKTLDRIVPIKSIQEVTKIIVRLLNALKPYHESGKLHLDIKPENIFVYEADSRIALFDFDAVQNKEDIRRGNFEYISYTEDWAAPELAQRNLPLLGEATDIYAAGAVFLYLLTGRLPKVKDRKYGARWNFKQESNLCLPLPEAALDKLQEIFRHSLAAYMPHRYDHVKKFTADIEELICLVDNVSCINAECRKVFLRQQTTYGTNAYRSLQMELSSNDRYFVETEISSLDDGIGKEQEVPKGIQKSNYKFFIDYLLQQEHKHHALIVAEGGMGKTTTLIKIWEQCCYYHSPPTLYIPLKDCKNGLFDEIEKHYRIKREELLAPCKPPTVASFIVLLDGYNELDAASIDEDLIKTRRRLSLLEEIRSLLSSSCLCILTSRTIEVIDKNLFKTYQLQMEADERTKFCTFYGLNPSPEMCIVLNTPMMLSLYRKMFNNSHCYSEKVLSKFHFRGLGKRDALVNESEILWNYYRSQVLKVDEGYTIGSLPNRLRKIALERILPKIAYEMCDKGTRKITMQEFKTLVDTFVTRENTLAGLASDEIEVVEILDEEFGFIQRDYGQISFVHDIFSDFFVAVYLIGEANDAISEGKRQEPPVKELPSNIKRYFVGAVDHQYLVAIVDDLSYGKTARSTASMIIGDVYYGKAFRSFPSRLTENISSKEKLRTGAIKYYTTAAILGEPLGNWNLGFIYRCFYEEASKAKNVQDAKKYGALALKHTLLACEKNLPYGFNQMGVLYQYGIGVEQNIEMAIKYYHKGIDCKVAHSYNRLGLLYEDLALEEAISGNTAKAQEYYVQAFVIFFEQAVEVGEEYAMNRLSCYYHDGFPEKTGKGKREALGLLGKFDNHYLDLLPADDKYAQLKDNPDRFMYNMLLRAATLRNKYAVNRYERLFSEE